MAPSPHEFLVRRDGPVTRPSLATLAVEGHMAAPGPLLPQGLATIALDLFLKSPRLSSLWAADSGQPPHHHALLVGPSLRLLCPPLHVI
jgi:hypothetical protein